VLYFLLLPCLDTETFPECLIDTVDTASHGKPIQQPQQCFRQQKIHLRFQKNQQSVDKFVDRYA
jgi:hypothetical protein